MSQTPERRMYLMWKARRRRQGRVHWQLGYWPGPYMEIARAFRRPVREVREIVEAQKGDPRGTRKGG